MTDRSYQLQRFVFGKLKGNAQSKPTILARSDELSSEQISDCLQVGRVDLPQAGQVSESMPATVGVFRGSVAHHILAVARTNTDGQPQISYLVVDPAAMSWLGGNLQPFKGLFFAEMQAYESTRGLAPLSLEDPRPAETDQQVDSLQNLMLYCQDNMKVVEGLLTALIAGQDISIINAPADLDVRLNFVEALVAMLPLPARPTFTFATNITKPDNTTAQVQFLAPGVKPISQVVFDWQFNSFVPEKYERHDYAKFIISQMRLDPSLVVEHARSLARTASWRAIRRDNLSRALHWVSRRARIDSAVQAGQPADSAIVTSILREDPTLSDDLRVQYSEHLLKMTFISKEWETSDVLAEISPSYEGVAKGILRELRQKAEGDDALLAYNLIDYWMSNVADAKTLPWQTIAHAAALQHLRNTIQKRDLPELVRFVYRMTTADASMQMGEIAEKVYDLLQAGAHRSEAMAMALLVFGSEYLTAGPYQAMLRDTALVGKLPDRLQKALAHLQPEQSPIKPLPDTVAKAVSQVPLQYQVIVLLRLIETALFMQRLWLIGERELKILVQLQDRQVIERFAHILRHVADEFSQPERLPNLSPAAYEVLPRLYFIIGDIEAGMAMLEHLQNNVLTIERLSTVNDLVGNIFLRMDLEPEQMLNVLVGFDGTQMRAEPRLRAYYAALVKLNWDKRLDILPRQLALILQSDPRLVRILGVDNSVRVLQALAEQENATDALRLAEALVRYALELGPAGTAVLVKGWKHLQWNDGIKQSSLELLRRYIRALDPDRSLTLPTYFAENISPEFGQPLVATRLVRIVTGGRNVIQLAQQIAATKQLLLDMAITYHEGKVLPPVFRVKHDLDSMPGGASEEQRLATAHNLNEIARLIMELGKQKSRKTRSEDKTSPSSFRSLLREAREIPPTNSKEFLTWLGIQFSDTFSNELGLERKEAAHILGARSVVMLYQESTLAYQLLYRLSLAFPADTMPDYELPHLKAEIDSLWQQAPLYEQQKIQASLSADTQQISLLLSYIADRCDARALADRGIGKQLEQGKRQPHNEIEVLRFISGYFARKHTQ